LAKLQAELVGLQAGALAASTRAKYSQYEMYWVRFLLVFGLVWFVVQPTEAVVSLYVAFWARSAAYPTVKNYLQGLQQFLLDRGWSGHFSQWRGLQQALTGLRHRAKGVQRKLPITPFILLRVVQVLEFASAVEVMVFTAILVAFGAFLRKAMCAQPAVAWCMCSVRFCARTWFWICVGIACMSLCGS
jgi:hypothetical protein